MVTTWSVPQTSHDTLSCADAFSGRAAQRAVAPSAGGATIRFTSRAQRHLQQTEYSRVRGPVQAVVRLRVLGYSDSPNRLLGRQS